MSNKAMDKDYLLRQLKNFDDDVLEDKYQKKGSAGSGDMEKTTYDPNNVVANAGGIDQYVDGVLDDKVDKVTGKGLSTNDYDDTAKGIVDGVTGALSNKVDKVSGKSLSTNDYTDTDKTIVDGITSALANKVDKVTGKGLSTNDYTDADKTKLNGLGTASTKDVASSGDALSSQVVMGNDSRLTNARNAADVSAWAKASTKPTYTASEVGAIATSVKGMANGVASLDANGKVPSSQLPSYVDDVLEYDSKSSFPTTGETGKIYVAKDTNKTYRWSGTAYVEISSSLALGETSSTAYYGDKGKVAYDHASAKGSAFSSGLYKITTNSEGHVTAATAVAKSDITDLGIPGSDTNNRKSFYGTCTTAAATQVKTVTLSDTAGWELKAGTIVGVKFTNTNTYSSTTSAPVRLNVNSTGDKNIVYNAINGTAGNTGTRPDIYGSANHIYYYMYDGTNWVWAGNDYHDGNNHHAVCFTAGGTAAKTATASWYALRQYNTFTLYMQNSNSSASALTLNVNGTGAKPIYINGEASSSSKYTLPAGTYFVKYDGTNYQFRTDDYIPVNVIGTAANVRGTVAVANGGTGQTTLAAARNAMGLGNTTGALLVANGGTGATSAADARTNLGIGNVGTLSYGSDTTKYLRNDGTWQVPSTGAVSGVKGNSESSYRIGNVNITAANIGLGNVGNFKAVSTVGSQGLTDTEKANARANIGAGTGSGTITGIKMNGASKGTSGVVDLGTVITSHQDISGKADKSATVSTVAWDSTNKKITKTINGTTSDVVTAATILGNLTKSQVTTALGYTPPTSDTDTKNTAGSTDTSSKIFLIGATSQAANPQTYSHDTAYVGTDGCLYSGGAKVLTAHDGNNAVTQTATTTSANYEVLFSVTADNTTRTEGARKNSNLLFNPSTGNLQATQLNGVTIGSSPKFTDTNTWRGVQNNLTSTATDQSLSAAQGKVLNDKIHNWTATQTLASGATSVTFTELDSSYAYDLYSETADGTPVHIQNSQVNGTQITYTLTAITSAQAGSAGTGCKVKLKCLY